MKENPFNIVANLFVEDTKIMYNEYLINEILSYQPQTMLLAVKANGLIGRIPTWATSALFNASIKKQKNKPRLLFVKKQKEVSPLLLKKISRSLCCNKNHATQVIEILMAQGKSPEALFGLKKGE